MAKFLPPTKESLAAFNEKQKVSRFIPPSTDDLKKIQDSEPESDDLFSMRSVKDFGIGTGQGITLGGADEIMAALQASGDVITGDTKLQDWVSQYRKHQQEQQQAFDEAKERSPVLTAAGEVAGGLALPMGAMGLGAKGLGLAGKAAVMGGTGAVAGGLSSKGTLEEDPSQLGKDILTGGAIGAVAGPAIEGLTGLAGKGLTKLGEKTGLTKMLKDSPTFRQTILPAKEGFAGRGFMGEDNSIMREAELAKNASEMAAPLQAGEDIINKRYTEVLKPQKESQLLFDLKKDDGMLPLGNSPSVQGIKKLEFTPEQVKPFDEIENIIVTKNKNIGTLDEEALSSIKKIRQGDNLSPQEAKNLQKYLRDNASSLNQGVTAPQLRSGSRAINDVLKEQQTGYRSINDIYGEFQDTLSELKQGIPSDQLDTFGKGVSDTDLFKTSKNIINKATQPYGAGREQLMKIDRLRSSLIELQQKDPSLVKEMGITDIPSYIQKIKDGADLRSVNANITGRGAVLGHSSLLNVFGTVTQPNIQKASLGIGKGTRFISDMGTKLTTMPAEGLSMLANKLSSNPSTRHMGEGLTNAIAAAPGSSSKNAVIFTILQNPNSRKAVQEMFGQDEKEE